MQNSSSGLVLRNYMLVLVILTLAVVLRIIFIGSHDFWLDELFSLRFAAYDLPVLIHEVTGFDNHPPTYYILLHYWILLFGDSETSLRIPSAIFSTLSVYFTYRVGVLLFDKRVAAIAGILLAASEFSIYYAQEARMYSLLAFASVLSVYFLLKHLKQQTLWSLFNYVWASTLLVYTHLYGLFVIVAENIYILSTIYVLNSRATAIQLRQWASIQIFILLLSLPWLWMLINRAIDLTSEGYWVPVPTPVSVLNTFTTFTGSLRGSVAWIPLMLLGMLSLLAAKTQPGRIFIRQQIADNEGSHIFLLCLLLYTPIVLPFIISQFITPIYIIRCTIAGHFAFYLLVAAGIVHIRWQSIRLPALATVLALSANTLISQGYVHGKATEFSKAVEYIGNNTSDNDLVLLCSHPHLDWPFRHYSEKRDMPAELLEVDENTIFHRQSDADKLWFIWRTDRTEDCSQSLHSNPGQYVLAETSAMMARNLGLTVFKQR